VRDGSGETVGLRGLDPAETEPRRRQGDRQLYYRIETGETLAPENVLHLAGLGFDGLCGYSPVKMARQAIGLALAAETYGAALFGNSSTPRGFLKSPKKLSKEAAQRMREGIERVHAGPLNAHRLAVLEEGTDWIQTSMSPEDAQFLATRAFQVLEIARIYRLPPHKIGDYSQSHLANIEASNLDYLTTTLMPWCEAMEQECNLKLLTTQDRANGYYFEHALTALLRGDMASRAEFYTKLRDLGVLTPNMICAFENLNPIGPEGDIRLVPLNMTTLDKAGKAQPSLARSREKALTS
jgi:HK97 family phage portal protein